MLSRTPNKQSRSGTPHYDCKVFIRPFVISYNTILSLKMLATALYSLVLFSLSALSDPDPTKNPIYIITNAERPSFNRPGLSPVGFQRASQCIPSVRTTDPHPTLLILTANRFSLISASVLSSSVTPKPKTPVAWLQTPLQLPWPPV